jgi:hypothetical protein
LALAPARNEVVVKLTAPPPPPPPDDGNPGANAPGTPEEPNQDPGASAPAPAEQAPAESQPETAAAPAARPLAWPAWYPGVDAALAGLVVLLALATASFVARNSDVWLHLAAGKRLLHGEYTPGTDPFSYTGADRPWVNHSWLADAGAYLLYGGDGKLLVAAKALIVAVAFGLLIAIRRPQYPLWPWAGVAGVAVLAAAPQFTLRPHALSIFFLALTLFILFRMPRGASPWRVPLAVGVTFWVWSNCDGWFILGPATLALLIVGELVQRFLTGAESPAESEPLAAPPDLATLAKALAVGAVACMLNPHHVRVWELPFELVGAPGAESDLRLRGLLMPASDEQYYDNAGFGRNANGVAFAALVVGGALALGFGPGRVRASHVALWAGFLVLAVYRVAAVPFFAVVAVPLIAAQLNASGAQAGLKSWGDPRSRLLWIGSSVGRVLCVLAGVALCVLSYPGWLQPEPGNPAYARRVAWGVEADPLLARAAGQLERWRERGALPPGDRGVIDSTELANYVAWFAPREKVFINSNLNHHRPELPDYLKLRRGLGLGVARGETPDFNDATAVIAQLGADYLAVSDAASDPPFLRARSADARMALYRGWKDWMPWYLDGQTTVFGYRGPAGPPRPEFAALRVDPVALAFAPGVARLPDVELKQPPPPLGWEEAFVHPPRPAPPGAAEALGWVHYKAGPESRMARRQAIRDSLVLPIFLAQPAATAGPALWLQAALRAADARGELRLPPDEPDAADDAGALRAAPLLALRAALRAVEANRDHPDPYFALVKVIEDPGLPMNESERTLAVATAYRQCLARLPAPGRYRRGQFSVPATAVALGLAQTYLGPKAVRNFPMRGPNGQVQEVAVSAGFAGMPIDIPGLRELVGDMVVIRRGPTGQPVGARVPMDQYNPNDRSQMLIAGPTALPLDAAEGALKLALQYAQADFPEGSGEEARQELERMQKEVQDALVQSHKAYDPLLGRGAKLQALVEQARRHSLLAEALKLLSERDPAEVQKEFGPMAGRAALLQVALELTLGQVEDADFHLNGPDGLAAPEKAAEWEKAVGAPVVQLLQHQKALQAGQYREAGELIEAMEKHSPPLELLLTQLREEMERQAPALGPILGQLVKAKVEPKDLLFAALADAPPPAAGPARLPVGVFQMFLIERGVLALNARQVIAAKLQEESRFFYRRGVLLLLEGDIPGAKRRFEQTARKPPPGWGLPEIQNPDAEVYLRLIERAARKAAAP